MTRGRLIVFDGPEGVGKTTQLGLVSEWLAARAVAHVRVREPGGTPLGDQIRRLLLESTNRIDSRAEALLFMASRAALVSEVVAPAIARGELVLVDRFFLSTYAYQVAGRGLSEHEIRSANRLATGDVVPDLTLLFSAPAREREQRQRMRGAPDRIESEGGAFHSRVAAAFAEYLSPDWQSAHPECGPIESVDASGTVQDVMERVLGVLASRWPAEFPAFDESHR